MADIDVGMIEAKVIEIVSEQMGVDKSEITRETRRTPHFLLGGSPNASSSRMARRRSATNNDI